LNSQLIEYTLQRFQDELQKRLAEIQRQATGLDECRLQRAELQLKAERLTTAIGDAGHSPALLSKLAEIETQIAQVNRREEAARL
jgi:transcription antitermination factor NusA-like protein